MPAQTQNKPSSQQMDEMEYDSAEEKKATPARRPVNNGLSFLKTAGIVAACVVALLAGTILRFNSTLFLEHREEEGFLTPEEYILVDPETGEPGQNIRTIGLHPMHTWDGTGLETVRGIGHGSSWQDVVDAYGDVYAYRINYQPYSNGEYDYSKNVRIDGPIKVSDFDEQYVKTGLCNPDTDRIYIRFQLWHDTVHVYYTEEEQQSPAARQNNTPWYLIPIVPNSADRDFELTISTIPEEGVEYASTFYF